MPHNSLVSLPPLPSLKWDLLFGSKPAPVDITKPAFVHSPRASGDALYDSLLELLRGVAARAEPEGKEPVDVESAALELQERISESGLSLTSLSDGLADLLGEFDYADIDTLLKVSTPKGGRASVRLDASFLQVAKPALMHSAADLEAVTVLVPAGHARPDVSGLQGPNGWPQVQVCHLDNNCVQSDEAECVRNDRELRGELLALLDKAALDHPQLLPAGADSSQRDRRLGEVASALMGCASHDEAGYFGWDFNTKLKSEFVPWVRALEPEAFTALQDSAERAGTGTAWVDWGDDIAVDAHMLRRLGEFTPLVKLSLSARSSGTFLELGHLQGGGVLLRDVVVRHAEHRRLCITLPRTAESLQSGGADEGVPYPDQWLVTAQEEFGPLMGADRLRSALLSHLLPRTADARDARAAAEAFIGCASLDDEGCFVWDFKNLASAHANLMRDFPSEVFEAMQTCAKHFGTGTASVALHDSFVASPESVARLAAFSPLRKLSIAAPALGIVLGLSALQGPGTQLQELEIRGQKKRLKIELPDTVTQIRSVGEGGEALLEQSKVIRFDAHRKPVTQPAGQPQGVPQPVPPVVRQLVLAETNV